MSRGCWTCRDRKVRCDLGNPVCHNCIKANRKCLGYGLRLSWPRTHRSGRTKLQPQRAKKSPHRATSLVIDMINVTFDDIHLFDEVLREDEFFTRQHLQTPKSVPLGMIDRSDSTMMAYYLDHGQRFFALSYGQLLMPLAFKISMLDQSLSSRAVQQAILALSSAHLDDYKTALVHKSKAIRYLSKAINSDMDTAVAFKTIMGSMLLCLFETRHPSTSSADWRVYLCGVKRIRQLSSVVERKQDFDYFVIEEWIYYHEVLAGASLVHWRPNPAYEAFCYQSSIPRQSRPTEVSIPPLSLPCQESHNILDAIAMISTILETHPGSRRGEEYMKLVGGIEKRLHAVPFCPTESHVPDNDVIFELYRTAAFIYFNRSVVGYSGKEMKHLNLVERAMSFLSRAEADDVLWPAFIIACEAHMDEERVQVLRTIRRSREKGNSGSIDQLHQMIASAWNLDDLDVDQQLSYSDKISAVVSSAAIPPPFF